MKLLHYSCYQKKILSCFIFSLSFFSTSLFAQPINYSVSNAHAHNDYEHPVPFYTAYNAGFGSIEADIFFFNNKLYVAHNVADTTSAKTLQSLYLDPLQKAIQKNKGQVYADGTKSLLLLIDLKTLAEPTLEALLNVLQQYKIITACTDLKIVITGNQPEISRLTSYPAWLYFDGNLSNTYTTDALKKVALFSDNFRRYATWNGEGTIADSSNRKIEAAVTKAHVLNKPIRFWAAPDNPNAWHQLKGLKVDYINTDKIQEISGYLSKASSNSLHKK